MHALNCYKLLYVKSCRVTDSQVVRFQMIHPISMASYWMRNIISIPEFVDVIVPVASHPHRRICIVYKQVVRGLGIGSYETCAV